MACSILLVGDEPLGARASGPGLRLQEMARLLGERHEVDVMVPGGAAAAPPSGVRRVRSLESSALAAEIGDHHVTVSPPGLLGVRHLRAFADRTRHLVVDLTTPLPVEGMHYFRTLPDGRGQRRYDVALRRLRRALQAGDLFLAASEPQRHFWLGAVLCSRDLPLDTVASDPDFRRVVATAPSGVRSDLPAPSPEADGGAAGEPVLVWGGGLWEWTDPLLLVRAAARARHEQGCRVRVRFPGTRHPDQRVTAGISCERVRDEAKAFGLPDEALLLEEGWTPHADRHRYLTGARVGVSLHPAGLESVLSWRYRILDYVWAALPVILTEGCPLASLIERSGAGLVVPPGDEAALARAIVELTGSPERWEACREAMRGLRARLDWRRTLAPLLDYCAGPWKAADGGPVGWHRLVRLLAA